MMYCKTISSRILGKNKLKCLKCQTAVLSSWSSHEIRTTFFEFYKNERHTQVKPSSIIPKKGDGTYFTNAGMLQFKPIFLGDVSPSVPRAVNSQKCIRVGGKHNDLDDVGRDLTHHTFFEMLGSWSFGDYFKVEACQMAHRLLTQNYQIPVNRLFFTYFAGDPKLGVNADEEVRNIWLSLGVPPDRILPFGADDNFWSMGPVGPCGPCTEIHYDHRGHGLEGSEVNADSPRVVEIWNLVFMQYNRLDDGSLQPLPCHHVDTGMGLERMCAVLAGTTDNYNTDLFLPLMDVVHKTSGCPKYNSSCSDLDVAYRMLADHIRMATVALVDGALPRYDQHGTNMKLKLLMNKSIRLCYNTFHTDPRVMIPQLVDGVSQSLGQAFPEIREKEYMVKDIFLGHIQLYDQFFKEANNIFRQFINKLDKRRISTDEMLRLEQKDLRLDTVTELAQIYNVELELGGYLELLQERESNKIRVRETLDVPVEALVDHLAAMGASATLDEAKYSYVRPDGYIDFSSMTSASQPSYIQGLSVEGQVSEVMSLGSTGEVIMDKTCFYSEAGGQAGDRGVIESETGQFQVTDVQQSQGYVLHLGHVTKGHLQAGQAVTPKVNVAWREGCMRNHTATHLMVAAMATVLPDVQQQASSVLPNKLVFEFGTSGKFETAQAAEVQSLVREAIQEGCAVQRELLSLDQARRLNNIKMLPNHTYPSEVSVISVRRPDEGQGLSDACQGSPDEGQGSLVSRELCCGTHVTNTAHLQDFCISVSRRVGSVVKNITAYTGIHAKQAHLTGHAVASNCDLLTLMLTNHNKSTQGEDVAAQQCLGHMTQAVDHMDTWSECQCWANEREDMDSTKSLFSQLTPVVTPLLGSSTPRQRADAITALWSFCHVGQKIELMPKAEKDQMKICADLEYKVMEYSRAVGKAHLMEVIGKELSNNSDGKLIYIDNEFNFPSRQLIKVLTKAGHPTPLLSVGRDGAVVLSLPVGEGQARQLYQPFTQHDLDSLNESEQKKGKGKLNIKGNKLTALYSFTMPTGLNATSLHNRLTHILKPTST